MMGGVPLAGGLMGDFSAMGGMARPGMVGGGMGGVTPASKAIEFVYLFVSEPDPWAAAIAFLFHSPFEDSEATPR